MAVVLRPVVQVEQNLADPGMAVPIPLPPLLEPVHDEVAGHLRGGEVEVQLLLVGQEDAQGGQLPPRLEVVIGAPGAPAALAAARERPDEDRRLGIAGEAEGLLRAGRTAVDFRQVPEDGIGLLHFFWGRLLATVRRRKPGTLSLAAMVCTEGNCSSV